MMVVKGGFAWGAKIAKILTTAAGDREGFNCPLENRCGLWVG